MKFDGFNEGHPPTTTYDIDDGLTIGAVDSAFDDVVVKLVLNRGVLNAFPYQDKQSYGSDADEAEKHEIAEELLADVLDYQQSVEAKMNRARTAIERESPFAVDVTPLRTNRDTELEEGSNGDESMYVFDVIYESQNRELRIQVGDKAVVDESGHITDEYRVGAWRAVRTVSGTSQLVSRVESEIRNWEQQLS